MPEAPKVLYRVKEAAEALSIGRTKLYELIADGDLKVTKIGKSTRIPVSEVVRLSQQRTTEARRGG